MQRATQYSLHFVRTVIVSAVGAVVNHLPQLGNIYSAERTSTTVTFFEHVHASSEPVAPQPEI
jgi:hypothetical protein